MANRVWSDDENDLIVADYFAMLVDRSIGRPFDHAVRGRALAPRLQNRSEGSIGFKRRNISAVLQKLGEDWLPGFTPADHFQTTLVEAVARWLAVNPQEFERPLPDHVASSVPGLSEPTPLWIGPAPIFGNRKPPAGLKEMLDVAGKLDAAGRDARNRALGRAGEERVLVHEKAKLTQEGRNDLAEKVRWVSEEDGDGAGYDIDSFESDGQARRIEVKTTNGWQWTPFHITDNELRKSEDRPSEWLLFRLWNFAQEPKAFELRPPLDDHVSLIATNFRAEFY